MKKAVVDINTKATETLESAIASKKKYQCKAIRPPFPKNFKSVLLLSLSFSYLIIKNNSNVVHAISIRQKTISLEFNPLMPSILPIIPVNPQISMVK